MDQPPPILELATPDDVDAIMRIERTPGYEDLVGRWDRDRHLEEMALPGSRVIVLREGDGVVGFAILQRFGDNDFKVHLKRIAVREPGRGHGSQLLQALLDWVYRETETNRIDLDLFVENARARRAYERVGFQVEGMLRDYHRRRDGSFASMWLMSILRRDWEARSP